MKFSDLLLPRHQHIMATFDDGADIVVVGGNNGSKRHSFSERYDTKEGVWKINFKYTLPDNPAIAKHPFTRDNIIMEDADIQ
jgi:hypothetical protein